MTNDFIAVGQSSGTKLYGNTNNIALVDSTIKAMTLRKTKPTVALVSGIASRGIPGLGDVMKFSIEADSADAVNLNAITFKLTATCNGATGGVCTGANGWTRADVGNAIVDTPTDATGWHLYDAAEEIAGTWVLYDTSGAALTGTNVLGFARFAPDVAFEIPAGVTKTFILKVDTTGAKSGTNGDTVRFDILQEGGAPSGSTLESLNEFDWGDQSVANIDGTSIKILPLTGVTIGYY